MAGETSDEECEECGAPRKAGLVACSYCETRYEGAPPGLNCPKCGDDNDRSQVRCATCASSLMRTCIFCEQASSIGAGQCVRCGESFDGAAERKRHRAEQQRRQQLMNLAATGLSALGQAAGSPAGRGLPVTCLSESWQNLDGPRRATLRHSASKYSTHSSLSFLDSPADASSNFTTLY